jgi:hypothetical protein
MKKFKTLLMILILLYAVTSGWMLGKPYIQGNMFSSEVEDQARFMNFGSKVRALNRLMDSARQNDIPITEKDIIIIRDEGRKFMSIETQWEKTVVLPLGLYTHTYYFHPHFKFEMGDVPRPLQ